MDQITKIVSDYVSKSTFRTQWEFPSRQGLETIKAIINRTAGVQLPNKNAGVRMRKSYRIVIDNGEEWVMTTENKKLLTHDRFPEEFFKAHNSTDIFPLKCHPGSNITLEKMREVWHCVPCRLVYTCISKCSNCCSRKPIAKPIAGRPIYSLGTMDRLQIDLIDMRSQPDGEFKWIAHAKDHFSKFTWAVPLTKKRCDLVTQFVKKIFGLFGPSKILQCDNGGEFTGSELKAFLTKFYPNVKLIHSRARHPQTNGCIERANGILESRIAAHMLDNGSNWTSYLDYLIHQINTSYSRVIKSTPFQIMFARKVNTSQDPTNEFVREEKEDFKDDADKGCDDEAENIDIDQSLTDQDFQNDANSDHSDSNPDTDSDHDQHDSNSESSEKGPDSGNIRDEINDFQDETNANGRQSIQVGNFLFIRKKYKWFNLQM